MSADKRLEISKNAVTEFLANISDEDLSVLRTMIGNCFHTIYAPSLNVDGTHLAAPSYSILVFDKTTRNWRNEYVVIRCKWHETPLLLMDYWQILVSCDNKPDLIEVDATGAVVAPCTVNYYHATPITRIEVYEWEQSDQVERNREVIRCDRAIRFEQESGKAFCIACQLNGPGIASDVHISEDPGVIRQFLEGCRIRVCLT